MQLSKLHIVFTLILLWAQPFSAHPHTHEKTCDRTLRVSAALDWPPYSWEFEGNYRGIDIEIVEHLLTELNYCWQYLAYPSSSRAFREFQKGNVDLIFAASHSTERTGFARFSAPYRQEDMRLVYHTSEDRVETYTDNATVVVNRGSYYGPEFEQFKWRCPDCVIELSLASDRLRMVAKQRIQYAIEDQYAVRYIRAMLGLTNIATTENSIHKNDVHFMFRPGLLTEEELVAFNQAIKINQADIQSTIDMFFENLK